MDMLISTVALGFLFLGSVGFKFFSSYQESKAFNELTGAKTTTWQAVWVELRVDCNNYKEAK